MTDEPKWVQNLRAEYERKIADLKQEIARLEHVCDHNRALQAEMAELEEEMTAWRQKACSLMEEAQ